MPQNDQNALNLLLYLPDHQKEIILKYIRERRTSLMVNLYLSAAFSILLFLPAILDLQAALHGGFFRLETAVGNTAMLLARRHRYSSHYVEGELFLIWCVALVVFIIHFIRGIGIHFGPNSDLDCVQNNKYLYEVRDCAGKSEDRQKHPYYLYDDENTAYFCPLFLDWKKAEPGAKMICLSLQNGRHYAILVPDQIP